MESIPVRLGSKRSYFLATWGSVGWSLECGVVVKRLCSRMVSGSQLIQGSDALRSKLKELGRNGCLPVCSKGHRRLNLSILTERARRMQYLTQG